MFICTAETLGIGFTAWGEEVKRLLAEKGWKQQALVNELAARGIHIHRAILSLLLRGTVVESHMDVIHEINAILDIAEDASLFADTIIA